MARTAPAVTSRLRARLRRESAAVRRRAREVEGQGSKLPVAVHELHRALRPLLVDLDHWLAVLSPSMRGAAMPARRSLRALQRISGDVRDRHVGAGLLRASTGAVGALPRSRPPRAWRQRLGAESSLGRAMLLRQLARFREERVLAHVQRTLASRPAPPAEVRLRRRLRAERRALRSEVVDRARRARKKPSPKRLHRLRTALRRARFHDETLVAVTTTTRRTPRRQFLRLERALGDLHDLDVLLAHLHRIGVPAAWRPWEDHLRKERARVHGKVAKTLARRKLRRRLSE